ncbi:ParA family protein [Patescibacteria group bacterium]|nr:ParA family protein [Patescibacteria group bacterium]
MKFSRTKKLVFCNNKGGVGKTTIAYHIACSFADKGYKTLMVDLDPQCNLTLHALGIGFFEENLFSKEKKTIYDVVRGFTEGETGIDLEIKPQSIRENLFIVPGDMDLVLFEEEIPGALGSAAAGNPRGFLITSAIDRFLTKKSFEEELDIIIIDTSPSLGPLNRITLLGADFFVVPATPDVFSVQGIENLGKVFSSWKETWRDTGKSTARRDEKISSSHVLSGEGLFAGYIINSYRQYTQPIKIHRDWMEKIKEKVKVFLSEKHCRNGLVTQTVEQLGNIKNYGKIASVAQDKVCAMFDLQESDLPKRDEGTISNLKMSKKEFDILSENILEVLKNY